MRGERSIEYHPNVKNLLGQKFTRLTVIERDKSIPWGIATGKNIFPYTKEETMRHNHARCLRHCPNCNGVLDIALTQLDEEILVCVSGCGWEEGTAVFTESDFDNFEGRE